MKPTPKILPDPYTLFINQVSSKFNIKVNQNKKGRWYNDYIRCNAILVMFTFSGIKSNDLAKLFNIDRASMYYNLFLARKFPQSYNEVLQIYIDTLRRFIHLNPAVGLTANNHYDRRKRFNNAAY